MTDFAVVIPARYASTRLPGKPLPELHGKPMIQHVHERAVESGASDVDQLGETQQALAAATARIEALEQQIASLTTGKESDA